MIPDCTLTTACFDLTPYNNASRSIETAINNMRPLLEVPCYLHIFTDKTCIEQIKSIRNSCNLSELTHYTVLEMRFLPKYKYLDTVKENREKYHPTKDARTSAETHILNISKPDFVLKTMNTNPFNTSKFGWIDANVGPQFSKICTNYENNKLLYVLENITEKFHIQVMHACDKKYKNPEHKREYYSKYQWLVCGCLFTTSMKIGKPILNRLSEIAIETINMGYGHGEEMLFLEILDEFYDSIERSYGDYNMILNNFISPTVGYHYIDNNIIIKTLNLGYNRDCYDCCEKLLREIEHYHVKIEYNTYFSILMSYFISAYYHNYSEAKEIANHIRYLIKINPYIKAQYETSPHYEAQLRCV